jgi:formylglycine-generating enzyme required for sulfatase activity
MKLSLPAKLAIAVFLLFGLLFTGMVVWRPMKVRYYTYRIGSGNEKICVDAAKKLLALNETEPVFEYYTERYKSKDVPKRMAVVDELCEFGDNGRKIMRNIFRNRCRKEQARIPAGSFMMGSENGEVNEKPVHKVTLSAFWMDKYEVTNEKYYVFVKYTGHEAPGHWKSGKIPKGLEQHPVVYVSWLDAKAYADWLSMELPTEPRWEYACRAGTTTSFYFGATITTDQVNYNGNHPCGNAPKGIYRKKTTPVGNFPPNTWGLYDMHGNAWEWCRYWFDSDYYKNSPTNDPKGPSRGQHRVLRGGSWGDGARGCRSALRYWYRPTSSNYSIGFRLSRSSR